MSTPAADPETVRREVTAWFFDTYLPRWTAHASGKHVEPPAFILEYWGVPMHVSAEVGTTWLLDEAAVLRFLAFNLGLLRARHYDHTAVLDRQVRVYHAHGAAIDIVWSRRKADGTEFQRAAMHYELARATEGSAAGAWKVVGMQVLDTRETLIPWQ